MPNDYCPTTEVELENWMKQNCFNFNDYSVNGNHIYEGCGIDRDEGGFVWYFTERGQKSKLRHFNTEREIISTPLIRLKMINGQRLIVLGLHRYKKNTVN